MNLLLLAPLLSLSLAAAPTKVLMLPVSAGAGVDEKVALSIGDSITEKVRKIPDLAVMSQKDIATLITVDKQKQLMGCTTTECATNYGSAVGAHRVVQGTLSKIGESWMLQLTLLDPNKGTVVGSAERRFKGGTLDNVLDDLGSQVFELFGQPGAFAAARRTPDNTPVGAATSTAPSPIADEPSAATREQLQKLKLATDGKGRYYAFTTGGGSLSEPLFVGDDKGLYEQLLIGGGRNGDISFDKSFWEPRLKGGKNASFNYLEGKYSVWCGDKQVPLTLVADGDAKGILGKAKYFKPRWHRQAFALARDSKGIYYFVDRARDPEDNKDFHLFIGKKGALAHVPLTDVTVEGGPQLFTSAIGELQITPPENDSDKGKALFVRSGFEEKLTPMDLWSSKRLIYTELGVYGAEPLGTGCDGQL